jgi:hypothetical protein
VCVSVCVGLCVWVCVCACVCVCVGLCCACKCTDPERDLVAALERLGEIQDRKLFGVEQLVVGERLQQLIHKHAARLAPKIRSFQVGFIAQQGRVLFSDSISRDWFVASLSYTTDPGATWRCVDRPETSPRSSSYNDSSTDTTDATARPRGSRIIDHYILYYTTIIYYIIYVYNVYA